MEDTGSGIAPEEIDSLFQVFVQTKTGQEIQEGTGLGLPISQKFVQLMGGEISVTSETGKGSIFKFDIEVTPVEEVDVEIPQPTRRIIGLEPDCPPYRILIVDDRDTNRQLLMKLLSPFGFQLQEAPNGEEALKIWNSFEPHLIWMDMRMPVMDGYEATKIIKATLKGQATAIIALTASIFEEERALVLSAGCDDFLRKPFRQEEIFTLMNKHLGVRYLYEEPVEVVESRSPIPIQDDLTPSAIGTVPPELWSQLEYAARFSYMEEINSLINEIRRYNAPLADAFATLAKDFEYDKISNLIQSARG